MRTSEKCHNKNKKQHQHQKHNYNNSDNSLTSRRTHEGKMYRAQNRPESSQTDICCLFSLGWLAAESKLFVTIYSWQRDKNWSNVNNKFKRFYKFETIHKQIGNGQTQLDSELFCSFEDLWYRICPILVKTSVWRSAYNNMWEWPTGRNIS